MIRYINELIDNKLIIRKRRGLTKSNLYYFIYHKWMDNRIRNTEVTELSVPDVSDLSLQDMSNLSHKENHIKEPIKQNQLNSAKKSYWDSRGHTNSYYLQKVIQYSDKYYPINLESKNTEDWIRLFRNIKSYSKIPAEKKPEIMEDVCQYLEQTNMFNSGEILGLRRKKDMILRASCGG